MRIYLLATLLFAAKLSFGQLPTPDDDGRVYTIPVVVHIMNPEKSSNLVTPMHVQYAIDYLNLAFAGKYPGMEHDTADGAAGDVGIRFELAKQDPEGNPTTGMHWVDAFDLPDYAKNGVTLYDTDKGVNKKTLKSFSLWPSDRYLNIWVVNKINGTTPFTDELEYWEDQTNYWKTIWNTIWKGRPQELGFAPVPNDGPSKGYTPTEDGVIVLFGIFKYGYINTLPHEIGHYLNLYHVDKKSSNNFMTIASNPSPSLLFTNRQKDTMRECIRTDRRELVSTFKETGDDNSEENNLTRFGNNFVFRNGKKLVLQLKLREKTVVLTNNRTDDRDDGVNYVFIGYSDDLNCYIVENVGYESSSFSFINRNNGAETIVPFINFKILPSKKWVVFYNNEGDESGNAFSFSEEGLEPL